MFFGAILALIGIAVFFVLAWYRRTGGGRNEVQLGPVKFSLSNASLVIFVGGVVLMALPFVLPIASDGSSRTPTPTTQVVVSTPTAPVVVRPTRAPTPTPVPTVRPTPTPTPTPVLIRVHSSGTLRIRQTFLADLDEGQEIQAGADVWFEADTATSRFITPRNGATIAKMGTGAPGKNGCAGANLSTTRVDLNQLPVGTYVCVKTNQNRFAQFRIDAGPGPSPGTLTISWTTWE